MTEKPKSGDLICVWFSCGAASAVAARNTVKKYGRECNVVVVNNPVAEEDDDNRRFMRDVERWIGRKIETCINPKYPSCSARDVWERRKFMSGPMGAPCTLELKKQARQHWEKTNKPDWHVLGFTSEEKSRYDRFILTERSNVLPILIEDGITKEQCFSILKNEGISPPRIYSMGYPNANCIGCVKATSPTYWNHVRANHPEIFRDREAQSREIGAKLVRYKGARIFLDELPEDAVGRPMRATATECGIFCEER